jgi:hypothetical protein
MYVVYGESVLIYRWIFIDFIINLYKNWSSLKFRNWSGMRYIHILSN